MSVSAPSGKKAPSQAPVSYYKMKQQGGARGKPGSVPVKQPSGPSREKGL